MRCCGIWCPPQDTNLQWKVLGVQKRAEANGEKQGQRGFVSEKRENVGERWGFKCDKDEGERERKEGKVTKRSGSWDITARNESIKQRHKKEEPVKEPWGTEPQKDESEACRRRRSSHWTLWLNQIIWKKLHVFHKDSSLSATSKLYTQNLQLLHLFYCLLLNEKNISTTKIPVVAFAPFIYCKMRSEQCADK